MDHSPLLGEHIDDALYRLISQEGLMAVMIALEHACQRKGVEYKDNDEHFASWARSAQHVHQCARAMFQ